MLRLVKDLEIHLSKKPCWKKGEARLEDKSSQDWKDFKEKVKQEDKDKVLTSIIDRLVFLEVPFKARLEIEKIIKEKSKAFNQIKD